MVSELGNEAIERVRELTAVGIARPGGAVGRVGVPHYDAIPLAQLSPMFP